MSAPEHTVPAVLDDGPILLYDGECGVCNRSVQWILEHEQSDKLRFAPLQSDLGKALTQKAEVPSDIDSVLWIERDGGAVVAKKFSSGVLQALRYVGGPWKALTIFQIVPRPLRDWAYKLFAQHRLKVAPQACLLPPPETRSRFLS